MNYKNLISDIDTKGYIEIQNFLNEKTSKLFKDDLENILKKDNNKKFALTDGQLKNFHFYDYCDEKKFLELVGEIFKYDKKKFQYQDNYKVLRILNGKDSNTDNNNLHFDGYHLTLMLPLVIPSNNGEGNGDFFIIPNIRPYFNLNIFNLLFKFIFQNKIIKFFYKTKFFHSLLKPIRIIPKVNSLIIFRGFASLHGSGKLDANKTRVTLLYHYLKLK